MSSTEQLIAIANTYLNHGLLDHQPDKVLFADHCQRIEMGYQTGGNAGQLRELLRHHSYRNIKAIEDIIWVVEAPYVDARYTLTLNNSRQTVSVATRFKIVNKLIEHIDITLDAGELQSEIIEAIQALRTDM